MKNILIYTVTAGSGHNTIAGSISQALSKYYGGAVNIKVVDFYKAYKLRLRAFICDSGYKFAVKNFRHCYNGAFKAKQKRMVRARKGKVSLDARFMVSGTRQKILSTLADFKPDVVLCTHFFPAVALSKLRGRGDSLQGACVGFVVTDYVVCPYTECAVNLDFVCTFSADFVTKLKAIGFAENKIKVIPPPTKIDTAVLRAVDNAENAQKKALCVGCESCANGANGAGCAEKVNKSVLAFNPLVYTKQLCTSGAKNVDNLTVAGTRVVGYACNCACNYAYVRPPMRACVRAYPRVCMCDNSRASVYAFVRERACGRVGAYDCVLECACVRNISCVCGRASACVNVGVRACDNAGEYAGTRAGANVGICTGMCKYPHVQAGENACAVGREYAGECGVECVNAISNAEGRERLTMVVMSGDGAFPKLVQAVKGLLSEDLCLDLVLINGKSEKRKELFNRIILRAGLKRMRVENYGFVSDAEYVRLLMRADVVVTKCGVNSLTEALLMQNVVITTNRLARQELCNVEYFQKRVPIFVLKDSCALAGFIKSGVLSADFLRAYRARVGQVVSGNSSKLYADFLYRVCKTDCGGACKG